MTPDSALHEVPPLNTCTVLLCTGEQESEEERQHAELLMDYQVGA